jgi:hemerythrin-like domain-containing protein
VCEHCGCRGIEAIAELMDEHYALLDEGQAVRRELSAGSRATALEHLARFVEHLDVHVRREEEGVFAALRAESDFVDEVEQLESEHRGFDAALAGLDPGDPELERRVTDLLRDLDDHVERENLGIFPVSAVTLGASGWELVDGARQAHPTFLPPVRGESAG